MRYREVFKQGRGSLGREGGQEVQEGGKDPGGLGRKERVGISRRDKKGRKGRTGPRMRGPRGR